MENARQENSLDLIFHALTNILTESTIPDLRRKRSAAAAEKAFHTEPDESGEQTEPLVRLPGVVSRKKQLIPALMLAEQE